MLTWCAWNQRWAPVPGSTVPLECAKVGGDGGGGSATMGAKKRSDMMDEDMVQMSAVTAGQSAAKQSGHLITSNDGEESTQTGYRSTVVGTTLYSSVVLAHAIIQFLLFALSVEYCEFPIGCNALISFLSYEKLINSFAQTSNKRPSPGPCLVPRSFSTRCKYCWHS
jgi:hypothetical protein